jgi:hypothetical protein
MKRIRHIQLWQFTRDLNRLVDNRNFNIEVNGTEINQNLSKSHEVKKKMWSYPVNMQ